MVWIRNDPSIFVIHEPWHLVLSVTTGGLHLTACGELVAPDDHGETAPPIAEPGLDDRCDQCRDVAAQAPSGSVMW